MTIASPALAGPHQHLRSAGTLAHHRDRVLARDAVAVRGDAGLPRAGKPDRDHGAVRALARFDPRLRRHRFARPCRVLRLRRLHRGPHLEMGLGRAAHRACHRGLCRRPARLPDELHHRALPASGADHDHARLRASAARSRQQRELADRRRRRAAGREHVAAARHVQVRPLRLHRLLVRADRAVRVLPGEPAADQLAVRAVAARHPRERGAHARDRRRKPRRTSARSTPSPRSWPASPARS